MQTLTQEAIDEQIRGFIALLTRQLEELTQLVEEMSTTRHPNSYPRTELGTTSGTAIPQSDKVTGVHQTRHRRRSRTSPDTDGDQWPALTRTTKRHIRTTNDASDLQRNPKLPTCMNISSTPSRPYQAEYTRTNNPRLLQTQIIQNFQKLIVSTKKVQHRPLHKIYWLNKWRKKYSRPIIFEKVATTANHRFHKAPMSIVDREFL